MIDQVDFLVFQAHLDRLAQLGRMVTPKPHTSYHNPPFLITPKPGPSPHRPYIPRPPPPTDSYSHSMQKPTKPLYSSWSTTTGQWPVGGKCMNESK